MPAVESIISGHGEPLPDLLPDVALRVFASANCAAEAMSTGTAIFLPGAELPYHKHDFSEAVVILSGGALFAVQGRSYLLQAFDCIHVPAGVAHRVVNPSERRQVVALWAFGTATPARELVSEGFVLQDRAWGTPQPGDPEHIVRFDAAPIYPLAHGTRFRDLFARRFGAMGICGGYGEFDPGSSLPCHVHEFDESISIISGEAICQVMGAEYRLSGCDTAFVPRGRPHRFLNHSRERMAMIWVYGGAEPERTIVHTGYCQGTLPWSGTEAAATTDPRGKDETQTL